MLIACPDFKIIRNRESCDQHIRIRHRDTLRSKQEKMMANLKPKHLWEIDVRKLGQRRFQVAIMDGVARTVKHFRFRHAAQCRSVTCEECSQTRIIRAESIDDNAGVE